MNSPLPASFASPATHSSNNANNSPFSSPEVLPRGLESADTKFQYAIQLLQESWNAKIHALFEENSKWKLLIQDQLKQISTLENDLHRANDRIADLQRQVEDHVNEKNSILDSKADLQRKYEALKRRTIDLQQFKKNIVEMVENGDHPELFRELNEELSLMREAPKNGGFSVSATRTNTVGVSSSSHTRHSSASNRNPPFRESQPIMRFDLNSNKLSSPSPTEPTHLNGGASTPSSNGNPTLFPSSETKTTQGSASIPLPGSSSASAALKNTAHQLYRDVRDVLSREEFEHFAQTINQLNKGELTIEQAMEKIQKVLKVESLLKRLRLLMEQAKQNTQQ